MQYFCGFCDKKSELPLKHCSKCLKIAYCDEVCQSKHWSLHKLQHQKQSMGETGQIGQTGDEHFFHHRVCSYCLKNWPILDKTSGDGKTIHVSNSVQCSKCKLVWYCNSSCSKDDWDVHKTFCHLQSSRKNIARVSKITSIPEAVNFTQEWYSYNPQALKLMAIWYKSQNYIAIKLDLNLKGNVMHIIGLDSHTLQKEVKQKCICNTKRACQKNCIQASLTRKSNSMGIFIYVHDPSSKTEATIYRFSRFLST